MSSYDEQKGIYFGSRGNDFKYFIIGLLKKGNLKKKYRDMLTDDASMSIYASAFTSELVDPLNNYQVLEQVGDLTGNKFIVNYMYEKFPQLDCTEGVKVVARLRINYGAKQSFSEIARKLGFWPFISATNELRQRKMKALLEDVFEAFLGATERILDKKKRIGVGYTVVYDILSTIFDDMDISLRYEDLYDPKTRLKELFDLHEDSLGPLIYKEYKEGMITFSSVYRVEGVKYEERPDGTLNKKKIIGGREIKFGEGFASLKTDAQQNAAASGIEVLKKQGWNKPTPEIYRMFNGDQKNDVYDKKRVMEEWDGHINQLQPSKEKTKYQHKYETTPLASYCKIRSLSGVESCMSLGADPNIPDSEGMYPCDLLFIGKTDENKVSEIIGIMSNDNKKLRVSKQVYNMYINEYVCDMFKTVLKIKK